MKNITIVLLSLLFFYNTSCQRKQHAKNIKGYDLSKPTIFNMPYELDEISGITFDNGKPDTIYAEDATHQLYILCKHCSDDNTNKNVSGYIFKIGHDGQITSNGAFKVDVKEIDLKTGEKKISFHPSAIAKNKKANEWYILSAVNKILVILDDKWKVKEVHSLDPSIFHQPEGIAFDNDNNLYISNERNSYDHGTILKFLY